MILLLSSSLCAQIKPTWQAPPPSTHQSLWPTLRAHLVLDHHPDKEAVQHYIHWWQQHPKDLYAVLQHAAPYLQYIYHQTQQRSMPAELAFIPFVESKYEVFAYSSAGAVGIWQMMPGTATGQGLKINWWYDGRRDVLTSTKAALDYLSYLYEFFNQDWLHAIAAYDAGEGTVYNAIKRNRRNNQAIDLWHLALPKETQRYIPKLLAICTIIQDPDSYGIKLPYISVDPYFSTVDIKQQIDIEYAARLANTATLTLRYLNPGFKRWATDPLGPHHLLIPAAQATQFHQHILQISKQHYTPWYHHVVNEDETLSGIALQYHTYVNTLKEANHLQHDLIKPGQDLLVPGTLKSIELPNHSALYHALTGSHLPGPKQQVHVVKAHDTLDGIAGQYGLTANQVYYWNHLHTSTLHPGQQLVLWLKHTANAAAKNSTYTITSGDNLSTLALRHGTTVKAIMAHNHLRNQSIKIGQKINFSS